MKGKRLTANIKMFFHGKRLNAPKMDAFVALKRLGSLTLEIILAAMYVFGMLDPASVTKLLRMINS